MNAVLRSGYCISQDPGKQLVGEDALMFDQAYR